jgi:rhodanese-related sulfurtransferase
MDMLKKAAPSNDLESRLQDYYVVDVREPAERVSTLGFIPTSVSLPLKQILEGGAIPSAPKNARLLMVCRSGRRSARAGEKLVQQGFHDVTNLEGGTLSWSEAGLTTVSPQERSTDLESPTAENARDALVACFIDASHVQAARASQAPADEGMLMSFLHGVFAGAQASFDSPSKEGLNKVVQALALHVKGQHDLESIARNTAEIMSLVEAIDD